MAKEATDGNMDAKTVEEIVKSLIANRNRCIKNVQEHAQARGVDLNNDEAHTVVADILPSDVWPLFTNADLNMEQDKKQSLAQKILEKAHKQYPQYKKTRIPPRSPLYHLQSWPG